MAGPNDGFPPTEPIPLGNGKDSYGAWAVAAISGGEGPQWGREPPSEPGTKRKSLGLNVAHAEGIARRAAAAKLPPDLADKLLAALENSGPGIALSRVI